MKIILKKDIQRCLGHLIDLSNDIRKVLIEQFIDDFLNFSKKTILNNYLKDKTSYTINRCKEINQDLISVSVKVKFIKDDKKLYREILVYGIDELKTLSYSRFRRTIYKELSIKKIDVNTITHLFIIIKYKY